MLYVAAMLPVFEYTDYRAFLTDAYQARKAQHSWFSYGVMAQRAGFKARDFLLRVMRGERCLSAESSRKVAAALDLGRRETEYFLNLVEYNQAKTDAQKEHAWGMLQASLSRTGNPSQTRMLTDLHREVMSRWHHLAIRSLLEMNPDKGDWEALGKRLHPPCTAAVVKRSIKLLDDAGLVAKGEDGCWRSTEKSVATSAEVRTLALRSFYRDCLKLAGEAIEGVDSAERNISGVTLGISERTYNVLVERLAAVREEISRLADNDPQADRVYQCNLLLFPLARAKGAA